MATLYLIDLPIKTKMKKQQYAVGILFYAAIKNN